MNNTNNALETLVQRDKQIKKANDKLKASINELDAELETTTNALSNHASNTNIHTSKEELIQLIVEHLESLDLGITKEVVSELPTENISDNTLYLVPNYKGSHNEYLYINDKWELVGSTETNLTDYYTKLETNALLEGKANSKHTHVVNDITDFPTIPTKLSQLENDIGFGTGGGSTDTSDCVHKTGDEIIDGIKTFTSMLKVSHGTLQVGSDAGYSVTYGWNGVIISKQPSGTYDIALPKANGTLAIDDNLVHRTGNEAISGAKIFLNDIFRKNTSVDLTTTPTGYTNTNIIFADKNDKTIAHFEYVQRPSGVNDVGIFAYDKNGVAHGIHINTNNEVIPLMSSSESYSLGSATYKWAKIYSNDVVHTSGAETINGAKTFTNDIFYKNGNLDLTVTPTSNTYANFIFRDKNNKTLGYLQYGKQTTGNGVIGIYLYDSDQGLHGLQVTSNNYILPLTNNAYSFGASERKLACVYSTKFYGELVGNVNLNQSSLKMTVKDSNSETTRTNEVILANSSNTDYGINAAFGGRSNTVVGAGESCVSQLNDLLGNSSENLYLVSDGHIYIKVGANTYANAKVITLNSSAELSGLAKIIATSFVGALTGNVTGNCSGSSGSCTGNSASATKASYLDNYSNAGGNKIYLDWDNQVDNYVGLKVDNTTMGGLITTKNIGSQAANSATYATTQATSDNSTKIATTAWVRTYVNSVVGSGSVGASISAYYSNATTVTATGSTTDNPGLYPADYSDYVNIAPTVGTIYTGSQLFSSFTPTASGTINKVSTGSSSVVYQTTASAKATFSGAFSSSAKYLCTTANAVKFRAYVSQGTPNTMGSASVVDQSSSKSIFIRVQ